jgi:hypothetical protein
VVGDAVALLAHLLRVQRAVHSASRGGETPKTVSSTIRWPGASQ